MARSYSAKGANASSGSVATNTFTSANGDTIVVIISFGSGPRTLSTLTDNYSNTYTAVSTNPQAPSGQFNGYCYIAKNITGGANHVVTATPNNTCINAIGIIGFTGRDLTTPVAFSAATLEGSNTSSHASAATGTLPMSGCDLVCGFMDNANSQIANNTVYAATSSGWTMDADATTGSGATTATAGMMYKNNVGTGTDTATFTNTNGNVRGANWIIALAPGASDPPDITDVNTDEIVDNAAAITITGTDFDVDEVHLIQGAVDIALTVDTANATTIVTDAYDIHGGALKYGAATLKVINLDAQEDTIGVTIGVGAGQQFVTGASIVTDDTSLFYDLDNTPSNGDQLETPTTVEGSTLTVGANGVFFLTPAVPDGSMFTRWHYQVAGTVWASDVVTIEEPTPDVTAPALVGEMVFSDINLTTATLDFTANEDGTYGVAVLESSYADLTDSDAAAILAGTVPNTSFEVTETAMVAAVEETVSITGLSAGLTWKVWIALKDAADNVRVVGSTLATPAQPALVSPGGEATGLTTVSGVVTPNKAGGTVYAVLTTSATKPSAAQVQAGQDHTGAAAVYDDSQASAGIELTFNATGASAGSTYYWHFQYRDSGANDSSVVSSAAITTLSAPTDILLSNSAVLTTGGVNAVVGTLSTVDVDEETFTYTLVAGAGDTNNADFSISGANLRCDDPEALGAGSYSVRIQSDDGAGTYAKSFSVQVIEPGSGSTSYGFHNFNDFWLRF
jgi:hypothetical protein